MKIETRTLEVLIAQQQRSYKSIATAAGITEKTLQSARRGAEIQPATAGKIAAALGVMLGDLIK